MEYISFFAFSYSFCERFLLKFQWIFRLSIISNTECSLFLVLFEEFIEPLSMDLIGISPKCWLKSFIFIRRI